MADQNKDSDGFTVFSGDMIGKTLAQNLIPVADSVRDLYTQFGLRAYVLRVIRTQWSGGRRGFGEETVTSNIAITPTPLIRDLGPLMEELTPIGLDEIGLVQVTQISGRYTEEFLLGVDDNGKEPDVDENVFYEIEFPKADGSVRRRFDIRHAPIFIPDRFQWQLQLEKVDEDRDRNGDPA